MTWQIELIQKINDEGDLVPLWTVIQWDDNNPNTKYESTITQAVKETCYS